ncbi:MAG: TAT-variant-translocated molybdopterin oxidoreductase [Acidobacteriaceae bacterium]|nr:TAT-variant-translocated molybdopterin oxidoreductase [Acidobacteriaceae bacterium]
MKPSDQPKLDIEQLRARLSEGTGPQYWRSLEEVANTPEFQKFVEDEFPDRTPDFLDPANRRGFLKVMGASLALAGMTACTKQPKETIVPYVRQPEEFVPGRPMFYATAMTMGGVGTGLLVESHLGRPTKVEGNPDHPTSLGASDYFHQASVLQLYDPDRSQVVLNRGRISNWLSFQASLLGERERAMQNRGAKFRILSSTVISPTLGSQIKAFQQQLPNVRWYQWDPAARNNEFAGTMAAFGRPVNVIYQLDQADVIVSLDADFLSCGPGNLRHAHDYAQRRRVMTNAKLTERPKEDQQEGYQPGPAAPFRNQASSHAEEDTSPFQHPPQVEAAGVAPEQVTLNRLYVVEAAPSPTGGMADHRFMMKPSEVEGFAWALAAALGVGGGGGGGNAHPAIPAIARDLKAHTGRAVVIPGQFQPPAVHALAHAMNASLGAVGKTVVYTEPIEANPVDQLGSIKELVGELNAGQVDTLLILGGNPVYDAPADLDFKSAIQKARWRAHLSLYNDETSDQCHWHVNEAHYLETWSDTRGHDGTISIVQPLIAPLYDGRTANELFSVMAGLSDQAPHETVRAYWETQHKGADFEVFWQTALHDGVVPNTAAAVVNVTAKAPAAPTAQTGQGMEVAFRPDPTVWDGSFSNNAWMQECPKPQSKMTWDNAVWISPATAQKVGVETGNLVELRYQGRLVRGPVWIMPGHVNDAVTIHFGYGRTRGGQLCNEIGFNAYALQTSAAPGGGPGLEIQKVGGSHYFAEQQHTQTMESRETVRVATLEDFKKNPEFATEKADDKALPEWMTLYPHYRYEGYKWGMSIDLNACVGCSACSIACQAENNIPVVGKVEVGKGRHMNWIRVDRYFKGSIDDPEMYFQPVPCMHCETAPCELVCPVGATVHSGDGLNQMIYNRCVGTRYCSNNCPYKVRRFNFLLYSDWYTQSLYPLRNPDVTVRSRGVMEKCTYCIQRINAAKIESEKANRRIADGEVVPACAQACPTRAITFGDINDPKSQIAQQKSQSRTYSLLEELNTRPRTTYMSRLRNPNPELQKS